MIASSNELENFFFKFKYLFHFIARAFLIAILFFLLLFGIILTIYFGDLFINSKSQSIKKPLFSAYIIVSPSMVPTIKINDAIIIKRIDNDGYNVGDIITFNSSDINYKGLAVTHRVVDKKGINSSISAYTTKGDNNNMIDSSEVYTDSIYGRVLFKIPKIGYLHDYLSKPSQYFICLLGLTLIFVLYSILKTYRIMKKEI